MTSGTKSHDNIMLQLDGTALYNILEEYISLSTCISSSCAVVGACKAWLLPIILTKTLTAALVFAQLQYLLTNLFTHKSQCLCFSLEEE